MQSRAKQYTTLQCWLGNLYLEKVPNVVLRCSSTLAAKFGTILTPVDNIFSRSHLLFGCYRSPDALGIGIMGLVAFRWRRCILLFPVSHPATTFHIRHFWFCDFWIPGKTREMQLVVRCLVWILPTWVIGLLNLMWLVSWIPGTPGKCNWVVRCLAWILPGLRHRIARFLELRSTVNSFHVALQPARELFSHRHTLWPRACVFRGFVSTLRPQKFCEMNGRKKEISNALQNSGVEKDQFWM